MRSQIMYSLALGLLVLVSLSSQESLLAEQGLQPVGQEDSTDVLEAVLALQKALPAPPTTFRPGHVSPRQISDHLSMTEDGFIIALPQRSLTPSPTAYKGMLYVSGGFGSREYYAFDAATGAVKWALDLDDDGPTSAVVEDDVVVFNTESCTIFAVDAFTGEMLWSHYLGDPLMSTPSIANGKVFTAYPAGGGGGFGVPQQATPPQPEEEATPTMTERPALQGTHVFIALDLKTGTILWQKWIDGDVMSAPVVEGDDVYVTTFPGTLYTFAAGTGDILAAHATRATSAPIIVENDVFMSRRADADSGMVQESISAMGRRLEGFRGSFYSKAAPYLDQQVQSASALKGEAVAYDAANGFSAGAPATSGWQLASQNIGQSNVSSLQAFQGSRILHLAGKNYATMGDEVVATDSRTGTLLWKRPVAGDLHKSGGSLATPPLAVDGKLILATLAGDVVVTEAETGEELRRYTLGEEIRYQPIVDGGRIYVSTVQGNVYSLDTGDDKMTGWPTWGANAAHTNRVK